MSWISRIITISFPMEYPFRSNQSAVEKNRGEISSKRDQHLMDAVLYSSHCIFSETGSFLGTATSVASLYAEKNQDSANSARYSPRFVSQTMSLPNLVVERLLMRRSIRRADFVIADSMSTASGVQEHYNVRPMKIGVVYPGGSTLSEHNQSFISDGEELPRKYFLFVGRSNPGRI